MFSMRCNGKKTLQTFQKGILISIKSIKLLFKDMNMKYNISYILTHRLNQDSLESFFSLIRSRGGLNDHPTPLNALHRIRIIVLGKNPGVIQEKLNIEMNHDVTDVEEYLVANVMATANININLDYEENNAELSDSSLSSSESLSATNDLQNNSEEDGFIYLCGWLARKFKNKYPYLGNYTKDTKPDHSYSTPSWLQHLSFGGLTEPTTDWINKAKDFEKLFKKFHTEKINTDTNVTKRLTNLIKKKYDMPEDLIKAFVLQRTYIRIKLLNDNLTDEYKKQKINKKMKKIVT